MRIESRMWNILMYYSSDSSSLLTRAQFTFPSATNRKAAKRGITKTSATDTKRIISHRVDIYLFYIISWESRATRSLFCI